MIHKKYEWKKNPSKVLIIKKPNVEKITKITYEMALWLEKEKNIKVFVEPKVAEKEYPDLTPYKEEDLDKIDFIICLGGDGTVLYVNTLFQKVMPPVMAFNLGSLGFLTPFESKDYKKTITSILDGSPSITERARLFCKVVRKVDDKIEITEKVVLNEVVIDRGPSPFLTNLECFCNGYHITTIQADGVIVATTTGSTAYSLSAGGSIVHPLVPAIMLTPICPHSLSFRPLVLPDSFELRLQVPKKSCAYASFDGKYRTQLNEDDYIDVSMCEYPYLSIYSWDSSRDWFTSLSECLNWNKRTKQKL